MTLLKITLFCESGCESEAQTVLATLELLHIIETVFVHSCYCKLLSGSGKSPP